MCLQPGMELQGLGTAMVEACHPLVACLLVPQRCGLTVGAAVGPGCIRHAQRARGARVHRHQQEVLRAPPLPQLRQLCARSEMFFSKFGFCEVQEYQCPGSDRPWLLLLREPPKPGTVAGPS